MQLSRNSNKLQVASLEAKRGSRYTHIASAKLNDLDPQAWLADWLVRINDHAIRRQAELLPWNWRKLTPSHVEAA
ncbi:hypothetical protein CWO89_07300 [Bradyrhizobium sp. Leo170]|nr:hypothetical protein CWO89_07300 [Bradyrhizobium sp. Leo170]